MATYDSVSFDPSAQDIFPSLTGISVDGTKFYMLGIENNTIYQYTLGTPYSLSGAAYSGKSFSVATEDTTMRGMYFKADGTKLYLAGAISDAVHAYTLATPWDISTCSYDSVSFSIATEDDFVEGVHFKSDGTKMYITGDGQNRIFQYTLSTPWDLTTASYDSVFHSVDAENNTPGSLIFKPDGTKFYITGDQDIAQIESVYEYSLGTAWDLSTVTGYVVYSVEAELVAFQSAYDLVINSTGTKMYVLGYDAAGSDIYQYTLSPAWSILALLRGIKITGFKKDFPTVLSYNGNSVALTPSDDSNTLATKLRTLLAADATLGPNIGALEVTTPATCDLHYTFEVTFSLLDTAAIPSSAENRDGTSVFTEDSLVSTLITNGMAHIEGIASGRSRLIAWDEDDIVYNSSSSDFTDFTPSAETGANQMTISSLKGRIIKCEGFTQGFVIYGTGNVVIATFNKSATSMYSFKPVGESEGLIDFRHLGPAKDVHYYWSSKGLAILDPEGKKFEFLAPELTDWIKKHRYPISIKLLSNRFLVIYIQDRNIAFSNRSVRNGGRAILAGKAHPSLTPVEFDYIAPGPNLYPTYQRAFLFDTQLGKWGSCDEPCKLLVSLTPYNQSGYQLSKNYQLMDASLDNEQKELTIRLADGYTYVANTFPTDSYILFGHYATHRDRFTKLVAIDTEYVDYPDATLEVEKSVDGAKVDFTQNVSYAQTTLAPIQGFNLAAKWFNILVKGHYHLKRLLVKGYTYGRRP